MVCTAGDVLHRDVSHLGDRLDSNRSGGGHRKKFGVFASMIFGLAGAAYATDASADDVMATKAAPAVTTSAPATCTSLEDFVVTACPLTWNGITVYGTIDGGVSWRSH